MKLVIYGDFNCPYSYLASVRSDGLAERGLAEVEWRAVEHDPDIAVPTQPADAELTAMLAREVDEVRAQITPGEQFTIAPPPFQPNSAAAVAAFASASPDDAAEVRRRLFHALWVEGRDLADPATIAQAAAPVQASADPAARVAFWRNEWLGLDKRLVPMLVLPDGYVSRGLGALARLAKLAAG